MKRILPLTFLLTYKMPEYMEKENNLMFQMRTCLLLRIRCQEKLRFPLQSLGTAPRNRFFFVNENGIKVNKENYSKRLKKQLFPAIKKLFKRADWIFVQDSSPSHRPNLVQDSLEKNFETPFR